MNTKHEIETLTLAICERLDLTLMQVMDAQTDLAQEHLAGLIQVGHLHGPEDAQLMVTLPEFWAWWRQRWANQDRVLLASISKLDLLEWHTRGVDTEQVYRDYCQHLADVDIYPNDVLMAAFAVAKRQQNDAYDTLKNLFQTT
jgi:hypothetical protein